MSLWPFCVTSPDREVHFSQSSRGQANNSHWELTYCIISHFATDKFPFQLEEPCWSDSTCCSCRCTPAWEPHRSTVCAAHDGKSSFTPVDESRESTTCAWYTWTAVPANRCSSASMPLQKQADSWLILRSQSKNGCAIGTHQFANVAFVYTFCTFCVLLYIHALSKHWFTDDSVRLDNVTVCKKGYCLHFLGPLFWI